jgi:hypothetical protein
MLGDGSVAKLAAPSGCLVGFSLLPSSEKSRSLNRLEKSGYSFSAYVVGMIYLVICLSLKKVVCSKSETTLQIDKTSTVITDPLSRKSQFKSSERVRTDPGSSPRYLLKIVPPSSYIYHSLSRPLNSHVFNLIQGDKHSPSLWRRATSHCGLPYTLKQQIHCNPRLATGYQQKHENTNLKASKPLRNCQ